MTTENQSDTMARVVGDWVERGRRIRERRESHGMTQVELGEKVDRSRDAVQDAESGKSQAGIERIERFLDEYEEEIAEDSVDDDMVEIEVTGPQTAFSVVVRGKVRDLAELEDSAARMARKMQIGQKG